MNYLLDTGTLIYFLKGHPAVVQHIAHIDTASIHTTIINQAELLYGAFHSARKKKNLDIIEGLLKEITILPFSEKAAYFFAEQKANLKKHGKLIADIDLMIGSICFTNNMTLVTNNIKHFSRITRLHVVNWSLE